MAGPQIPAVPPKIRRGLPRTSWSQDHTRDTGAEDVAYEVYLETGDFRQAPAQKLFADKDAALPGSMPMTGGVLSTHGPGRG